MVRHLHVELQAAQFLAVVLEEGQQGQLAGPGGHVQVELDVTVGAGEAASGKLFTAGSGPKARTGTLSSPSIGVATPTCPRYHAGAVRR